MIDVTLLGTSALLPLPDRALTAAVLSCGGRSILFDCGEGTQTAARKASVSLMKCDLIALTHYHGDHIFGLPGLLQTLGVMGRTEKLTVTGPEGLCSDLQPMMEAAGDLPFPVVLLPWDGAGIDLSALHPQWPQLARLAAFPTCHRGKSQGYVFTLGRSGAFHPERAEALGVPKQLWSVLQRGEAVQTENGPVLPQQVLGPARRGLRFVFTGDTAPCSALTEAARDADLTIIEATYGEDEWQQEANRYGHMTFSQAGAAASGARQVWLSHFSQRIEDPEACLPLARAHCPAALCGQDGMRTTLAFPAE